MAANNVEGIITILATTVGFPLVIIGAGGGVVWFLNSIFEGWLERRKQTARDFQTIAAYTVRNNELLEELNKSLQKLEEKARDLH